MNTAILFVEHFALCWLGLYLAWGAVRGVRWGWRVLAPS